MKLIYFFIEKKFLVIEYYGTIRYQDRRPLCYSMLYASVVNHGDTEFTEIHEEFKRDAADHNTRIAKVFIYLCSEIK